LNFKSNLSLYLTLLLNIHSSQKN